jgi:serine/threonine protein kinase
MKGGRFEIPPVHGAPFARLIHSMVTLDPKRRISAAEALDDPWITGKEPPPAPPPTTPAQQASEDSDDDIWGV